MKSRQDTTIWTRAAVIAAVALTAHTASADTVLTTYTDGDVFVGFRQTGVTNTISVKIGGATKYLPPSLGGTWDGNPFKVIFGIIPGSTTVVDNLGADLVANFGADWSDKFTDGSGVRWAVVGLTSNVADNSPINGYNQKTAFVTKARIDPSVKSATFSDSNLDGFAEAFNGFAQAIGQGSYVNQNSTANSSVAFLGDGSQANNWNTKILPNGTFGLGSNRVVEQLNSGTFQGTTNSVLDLYVLPSPDSSLTIDRTYTGGSFTLNAQGELTYGAIPEPGSAALVGAGVLLIAMVRRRRSTTLNSN